MLERSPEKWDTSRLQFNAPDKLPGFDGQRVARSLNGEKKACSKVYISLLLSEKKGEKGYRETPVGIVVESPNR